MISLYIHVPFCRQRCVYCDFYFVTGQRNHRDFVDALCQELRQVAHQRPGARIGTLYFGGGTPSRLSVHELARLLAAAKDTFEMPNLVECTIEANPEDISDAYLQDLRDLGINRISLGIQSFFDDELQFMNRSHDAMQATGALATVADAGFESYTVDLIFGLPGQTRERWAANLNHLLNFRPPHVSAYALTVEKKTPLNRQVTRGLVAPVSRDKMAALYQMTMDTLRAHGYEHYEISSFGMPGHRARHNQQYWTHANYLGLGPSAHSFWWPDTGNATRWSNHRSLRRYVSLIQSGKPATGHREVLTSAMLGTERIMLGLRTAEGVPLDQLKRHYGIDLISSRRAAIEALAAAGLVLYTEGALRLTDRGKHVCDSVTARLIPDE